ncbi:RsmD family RNA methyltransferase [Enterovirga sp.]|jgi:16S rRNA (guanine966-N2)-methyltransferase|uniref:RsmD family RNA methyltransferase n=1 Tax=Enterovirga sp. TaxID=2026350 RepID=UPI00261F50E3|nr:RsmD family RNA methyltransferase [Enterovirga sp.]MDB5589886.1 methyltransferase [Enterovirga sp.]
MRIVGGNRRGLVLAGPGPGQLAIRPTSDRLRETLFNILEHGHGDPVPGARVLDLFAGTGALGIEALSRGAALAVLVDLAPEAQGLIRRNLDLAGALGQNGRAVRRDATQLGRAFPLEPSTLVFCDPPYGQGLAEKALVSSLRGGWLAPGALVVVEETSAAAFAFPAGFSELDRRRYGATEVIFGLLSGAALTGS